MPAPDPGGRPRPGSAGHDDLTEAEGQLLHGDGRLGRDGPPGLEHLVCKDPGRRVPRPGGNLAAALITAQHGRIRRGPPEEAVDHHQGLLHGHGILRPEQAVSIPAQVTIFPRPGDRLGAGVLRGHVPEGALGRVRAGPVRGVEQHLGRPGPGHRGLLRRLLPGDGDVVQIVGGRGLKAGVRSDDQADLPQDIGRGIKFSGERLELVFAGAAVLRLGQIAHHRHISPAAALPAGVDVQAVIRRAAALHRQRRRRGLGDAALHRDALAGGAAHPDQAAPHIGGQPEGHGEVIGPRRDKSLQRLYTAHEQVAAVVIAGEEDALPRPVNGDLGVFVAEFIKLLHALGGGIVGVDGGESGVVLLEVKEHRAVRRRGGRGASGHHVQGQQGCETSSKKSFHREPSS